MKIVAVLSTILGYAAAAPAIVWSGESNGAIHSSDVTDVSSIVKSTVGNANANEASLEGVIFVVNRDLEGSDGLTSLSASGALPTIGSKYESAHSIHHYVRGIDNTGAVVKSTKAGAGTSRSVVETTLHEFNHAITSPEAAMEVGADGITFAPSNRARSLASADLMIVHISNNAEARDIDSIVSSAIDNSKIGTVILTAVRSRDEVKLERNLAAKARHYGQNHPISSRRRLEDADNNKDGNNDDEDDDVTGVYFVNYTPNILSGVLFFFFFVAITYTGIGCMSMIAGPDVYVQKYPTIGREA